MDHEEPAVRRTLGPLYLRAAMESASSEAGPRWDLNTVAQLGADPEVASPDGFFEWIVYNFGDDDRMERCVSKAMWKRDGDRILEKLSRAMPAVLQQVEDAHAGLAAALGPFMWALKNEPALGQSPALISTLDVMRKALPLLRRDHDFLTAERYLLLFARVQHPKADQASLELFYDFCRAHLESTTSKISGRETVALLMASLSVQSPQLGKDKRVKMIPFETGSWLDGDIWSNLITMCAQKGHVSNLVERLAAQHAHLLDSIPWNMARTSPLLRVHRLQDFFKQVCGEQVFSKTADLWQVDCFLDLVESGFVDSFEPSSEIITDPVEVSFNELIQACFEAMVRLPPRLETEQMLIKVIGFGRLQMLFERQKSKAFSCMMPNAHEEAPSPDCTFEDDELDAILTELGSASGALEDLYALTRPSYLGLTEGVADEVTLTWCTWFSKCIARNIVTRKLRIVPNFATPQALFGFLARSLVAVASGEWRKDFFLKARLLCLVTSQLEREMFLAFRDDQQFFVANRRVCQDFFSRLRPALIAASLQIGYVDEAAVGQGFERLGELRASLASETKNLEKREKLTNELRHLIMTTSSILAWSSRALEMRTLEKWTRLEVQMQFPWLPAMINVAEGRFESGAARLQEWMDAPSAEGSEAAFVGKQLLRCSVIGATPPALKVEDNGRELPMTELIMKADELPHCVRSLAFDRPRSGLKATCADACLLASSSSLLKLKNVEELKITEAQLLPLRVHAELVKCNPTSALLRKTFFDSLLSVDCVEAASEIAQSPLQRTRCAVRTTQAPDSLFLALFREAETTETAERHQFLLRLLDNQSSQDVKQLSNEIGTSDLRQTLVELCTERAPADAISWLEYGNFWLQKCNDLWDRLAKGSRLPLQDDDLKDLLQWAVDNCPVSRKRQFASPEQIRENLIHFFLSRFAQPRNLVPRHHHLC